VIVRGGPFRKTRLGVCNIGTRPTLDSSGSRVSVEVHVPGHAGELYGTRLSVGFLRFIRGERRFPSVSALLKQIKKDIASALS
jgi:riboflavin kinase/FMN adenylyltransferase